MRRDGVAVDAVRDHFGFRTIEARDGKLYLNGKPFYLRAALDQDYYPETICSVPSVAFLEDQFRKAKELGLNALRCHLKVPDPRYYEAADRIGLLIWAEVLADGWIGMAITPASSAGRSSTRAGAWTWCTIRCTADGSRTSTSG
jgi:beta-galactosidase/beta-glucuronidase